MRVICVAVDADTAEAADRVLARVRAVTVVCQTFVYVWGEGGHDEGHLAIIGICEGVMLLDVQQDVQQIQYMYTI